MNVAPGSYRGASGRIQADQMRHENLVFLVEKEYDTQVYRPSSLPALKTHALGEREPSNFSSSMDMD